MTWCRTLHTIAALRSTSDGLLNLAFRIVARLTAASSASPSCLFLLRQYPLEGLLDTTSLVLEDYWSTVFKTGVVFVKSSEKVTPKCKLLVYACVLSISTSHSPPRSITDRHEQGPRRGQGILLTHRHYGEKGAIGGPVCCGREEFRFALRVVDSTFQAGQSTKPLHC